MRIYRDHSGALLGSQPFSANGPIQIPLSRAEGIRTLMLRLSGNFTNTGGTTGTWKQDAAIKELIKRVQFEANGHLLCAPVVPDCLVYLDAIHEGRSPLLYEPVASGNVPVGDTLIDVVVPLVVARDNSELFDSGVLQTFNCIVTAGSAADMVNGGDGTYTFTGTIQVFSDSSIAEFDDADRANAGLCAYWADSKSNVNGNQKFYGPADRDVECLIMILRSTTADKLRVGDIKGEIAIKIGSDPLIDPMQLGMVQQLSKEAYNWENETIGAYVVPLAQPFGSLSKDISTAGRQLEVDLTTTQNVDVFLLYAARIAPQQVNA